MTTEEAENIIDFTHNEFWEWWINGKLPEDMEGMRKAMDEMKKVVLECFKDKLNL